MPNDANGNTDAAALEAAATAKFNTEVDARVTAKLPDAVKAALPDAVKAALPQVPDKYDLKLPDKASLKATDLEIVAKTAKELGLPQDKAQKYMETLDSHTKSILQGQQAALEQTVEKWGADAAADEEIGGKDGSKIAATKQVADAFLTKFGSAELMKFLSETGLGNHPGLIRAFYRAGLAMKDDTIVIPKGGSGSGGPKKTTAEKLYGASMEKAKAAAG
jgi:hypothetical protein